MRSTIDRLQTIIISDRAAPAKRSSDSATNYVKQKKNHARGKKKNKGTKRREEAKDSVSCRGRGVFNGGVTKQTQSEEPFKQYHPVRDIHARGEIVLSACAQAERQNNAAAIAGKYRRWPHVNRPEFEYGRYRAIEI